MLEPSLIHARRGSILATSVSLVAVFLTLVVGGMAYVQSSQSRTVADKFRMAAEQAARTGMDFVLGFGEANIDRETRLPRGWDSMADGDVIDPVFEAVNPKSTDIKTDLKTATTPGQIVGAKVHEYVLGRQGNYITTFKARVQQFQVSDNFPRQYRIGVIGRVRKVKPSAVTMLDGGTGDERGSIIAERVILAHVGKQPVSRYAALIDIDVVRNWVPGEVVEGPVHINRGYIDELPVRGQGFNVGTQTNVVGDAEAATPPVAKATDMRSRMDIILDEACCPGNPGFAAPAGGPTYPIFKDEVTVTEIGSGDLSLAFNNDLGIKNWDHNFSKDDTAARAVPSLAISVNSKPWGVGAGYDAAYSAKSALIFPNAANLNNSRYGPGTGNPRGPNPVPYPVALPRSVRNRLASAVGAPVGGVAMSEVVSAGSLTGAAALRWDRLPDGVYIPTTKFWAVGPDGDAGPVPNANSLPAPDSYSDTYKTTGGIYVRGNVEIMRMAAGGDKSYYCFQLGPGRGAGPRRAYVIAVDRTNNRMAMKAWAGGTDTDLLYSILSAAPISGNLDNIFAAGLPGPSANTNPMAFIVGSGETTPDTPNPGVSTAVFSAAPGLPPFNGVIYVDCAKWDQARPEGGPFSLTSTPLTGNILCLGDPGRKASQPQLPASKYILTAGGVANKLSNADNLDAAIESVATYAGTDEKGAASKLTIMARGNIFIQNHIVLESLRKQGIAVLKGAPAKALSDLSIRDSRDLLGLVADKQIVVGLAAPGTLSRGKTGLYVQAAVAALGDPAFYYKKSYVPDDKKSGTDAYAGSFGTEGLLQVYGTEENYQIADGKINVFGDYAGTGETATEGREPTKTYFLTVKAGAAGDPSKEKGYPGNPFYEDHFTNPATTPFKDLTGNNPNKNIRGDLVLFGSLTEKKRGIKGQGNRSYDKSFKFDRRLLSIAPPIFPASLNIILKTQSPFSPDATDPIRTLNYEKGGAVVGGARELDFLSE